MHYYQHYSFDLWLTLIKSNPEFKIERTKIFHRDFNTAGKSLEDVARAFRQVDIMCNAVNEQTGKNIDPDELYLIVISLINDNQFDLGTVDTVKLYDEMEALALKYHPVLYSDETIEVLAHLKEKAHATLSILSNTAFIKGETLRKVLLKLDIAGYFDFQLYSDEWGMSKPNLDFFNLMIQKTRDVNKGKQVDLENIIHIGDNKAADVEGAEAAGIKSMLVNSNHVPVLNLIK